MHKKSLIVAIILIIFATFGTTYIYVGANKDLEMLGIKAQLELDLNNLNEQVDSLNEQMEDLTETDEFYGVWAALKNDKPAHFPRYLIVNRDKTVFVYHSTGRAMTYNKYWSEDNKLYFKQEENNYTLSYEFRFKDSSTYDKIMALTRNENSATYVGYDNPYS